MDVILATLVLAGIVLVIGAGLFERWVAPQVLSPGVRRVLWAGLLVGSMVVIVASFGDVAMTATRVLRGRFDLGFMGEYLVLTRHGRGALASVAATLALLGWGLWRVRLRRVDRLVHAALSVGLLTSWRPRPGQDPSPTSRGRRCGETGLCRSWSPASRRSASRASRCSSSPGST